MKAAYGNNEKRNKTENGIESGEAASRKTRKKAKMARQWLAKANNERKKASISYHGQRIESIGGVMAAWRLSKKALMSAKISAMA
jgi:hypothetical protein